MRYRLIDYMHNVHLARHAEPLSANVTVNGVSQLIDTSIPNYTIKKMWNLGGRGKFFVGVFLEGGASDRKEYFRGTTLEGYKGQRKNLPPSIYEGVERAIDIMVKSHVSCYKIRGLEADDLLYSAVKVIQAIDSKTPIDIITNDSDLLPLVDDQVSVFMRGTRTYADDPELEIKNYYQVTPKTWAEYLSYTSAYKQYLIPFNSMLFFKLLRGDTADNIAAAAKGYGGKKYTALMEQMLADGVEFDKIFRYGLDFDTHMKPVLDKYLDADIVAIMRFNYIGLGLQYRNIVVPRQMDFGLLQQNLNGLQINLPYPR